MKTIIFLLCGIILLGCTRTDSTAEVKETATRNSLKETLMFALIATSNSNQDFHDIGDLRAYIEREGKLKGLDSYGSSNIVFNPDLRLWFSTNQASINQIAILLCKSSTDYLGVYFDGRLIKEKTFPVKWVYHEQ